MFRLLILIKNFLRFSLIFSLLFYTSCSGGRIDPFDYDTGLTRNETFDTVIKTRKSKKELVQEDGKAAPIPKMSKLIVSPPPPVIGGDKLISFSITDQVPLKDALVEFGRMVNIDVDIDPNITGGIILNAKNRPLKEVIDRIATLGGLRYTYKDDVLHFEQDAPYMKNYFVDYLVGGTLWTDVETNITSILKDATASSSGGGESSSSGSSLTSNKSAGIISVFATDKQHQQVNKYLSDVEKYASAQVLIEAKIVEVNLSKEYSAGINWNNVNSSQGNSFSMTNGYGSGGALDIVLRTIFASDLTVSISALEKFGTTKTISSPRIHAINNQKATLNFTDKLVYFQVQQTQSNTSTTGDNSPIVLTTLSSTKQEESVGITLEIIPSINLKSSEITMDIKPRLSVLNSWVTDPASPKGVTDAAGKTVVNQVPVIQAREITTSAKIQNGNILVIGGLMKDESTGADSGVPLIQRIPVIGWLFKSMSRKSSITETVIFIKATIVNSGTPARKEDRDVQEKFDPSRRSFF
ncbi:MAG: hypothetical protein FJX34_04170 [Alphaproteobacteria bacterium]|nr:hypothetical protein [Alphaproteobacteria bacterium]